jgi:hypothetical protein
MNKNEPSPTPEALEQPIPNKGIGRKWKIVLAFCLGVISFFGSFFLSEVFGEFGDYALFIGMGACFLIAQYLLSRGNPQALRKDWPLIIGLNFAPLCVTIKVLAFGSKQTLLVSLLMTISSVACSYAGAALAARTAHR